MTDMKQTAMQEAKNYKQKLQALHADIVNQCPMIKTLFMQFADQFVASVKLLLKHKDELKQNNPDELELRGMGRVVKHVKPSDAYGDGVEYVADICQCTTRHNDFKSLPDEIQQSLNETSEFYEQVDKVFNELSINFVFGIRLKNGGVYFYNDSESHDEFNPLQSMFNVEQYCVNLE